MFWNINNCLEHNSPNKTKQIHIVQKLSQHLQLLVFTQEQQQADYLLERHADNFDKALINLVSVDIECWRKIWWPER